MEQESISPRVAAASALGLLGGVLVLYLPSSIGGFDVPLPTLVLTGAAGALVGRGWTGLIATVGGAALGATFGLVAWGALDLPGSQYIPLGVVILAVAIPAFVGGTYAVVRGSVSIVLRVRGAS